MGRAAGSSGEAALDTEVAFDQAGAFGRAQVCLLVFTGAVWTIGAWAAVLPVFVAADPSRIVSLCPSDEVLASKVGDALTGCSVGYVLREDEFCNEASPLGSLQAESPSDNATIASTAHVASLEQIEWAYDRPSETVTAEWGLYCSDSAYTPLVGSMFFLGFFFGNIALAPLPDAIGRTRAILLALSLATVGSIMCAVSWSFRTYLAGRFVVGFANASAGASAWLLACEGVGKQHVSIVMIFMNCMWAVGCVTVVPAVLMFPAWRTVTWLNSIMFGVVLVATAIAVALGVESPPWLSGRGEVEGFHRSMAIIARLNGRSYAESGPLVDPAFYLSSPEPQPDTFGRPSHVDGTLPPVPKCDASADMELPTERLTFVSLLTTRPWAGYTAAFSAAFCACSLGYYGLALNVGHLGGDAHVSAVLAGLAEIPGVLLSRVMADNPRFGRKGSLLAGLAVSGACCLTCVMLPQGSVGIIFFANVGKMAVVVAYCVVFVHCSEVYPAVVRGFALNLFQSASRASGVLAPIVVSLPPPWPLAIIGIGLVAVLAPLLILPETLDLPTSIAERTESRDDDPIPTVTATAAATATPDFALRSYGRLEEGNRDEPSAL